MRPGPLLDRAGIPGEVVVDHVPAEALEVDAFAHHLAADQDVREERRVERPHQSEPGGHDGSSPVAT